MTRARLISAGLALVVAAGVGVAFQMAFTRGSGHGPRASSPSAAPLRPSVSESLHVGDEVFAVEPSAVRGIDYETRHMRLEAVRVNDEAVFALTQRDSSGRVVAHCQSGKAWDGLLPQLSSLRVRRTLSESEARSLWARVATDAATLRVRDTFAAEPSDFQVGIAGPDVIVRDPSGIFIASLPVRVLDVLAAGCR